MPSPSKRHQPQQPAAAAPPAATIHDLPDVVLAHCLSFLWQDELFQTVAFVSKRFHSLTCSPEVLRQLILNFWIEADTRQRLEALLPWLTKHAGSLHSLELVLGVDPCDPELTRLLDECIAAASSGGALHTLTLGHRAPYSVGSWAHAAGSLRQLTVWSRPSLTIPFSLEGLSQLEHLDVSADTFCVLPGALLPPSLTRLDVRRFTPTQAADTQALQIGHLPRLQSLRLSGTPTHGLMECPGALVAGLPSLPSPLEHLHIRSCPAGRWLPAAAQHLSALRTLELSMDVQCQPEEQPAWHASLNAALAQLSQLTALWLQGRFPHGFPAAVTGLAQLERLCWIEAHWQVLRVTDPLPHGPYQRSMRRLVVESDLAQISTATLAGMPQLERLSLTDAPTRRSASLWREFWRWAAGHEPLHCLECMPGACEDDGYGGKVPVHLLNAMLELAARRPALRLRGLPFADEEEEESEEEDNFRAYREAILGQWK